MPKCLKKVYQNILPLGGNVNYYYSCNTYTNTIEGQYVPYNKRHSNADHRIVRLACGPLYNLPTTTDVALLTLILNLVKFQTSSSFKPLWLEPTWFFLILKPFRVRERTTAVGCGSSVIILFGSLGHVAIIDWLTLATPLFCFTVIFDHAYNLPTVRSFPTRRDRSKQRPFNRNVRTLGKRKV